MKVQNSLPVSPFGGLNFVLDEFDKKGVGKFINQSMPTLAAQSKYSWKDILYSFWSVFFCGGDCAEDLSGNFSTSFKGNPLMSIPSPDRVLGRIKELAVPKEFFETARGEKVHEISTNNFLTDINLGLIKNLGLVNKDNIILDYDNTIIFTEKADAKVTYKKGFGYCPGVALIGNTVAYIENRNGNTPAQTLQEDTLNRMFLALASKGLKVKKFRADGASYKLKTLSIACKYADKIYIRACKDPVVMKAIPSITEWQKIETENGIEYLGSTEYTPFKKRAKEHKLEYLLQPYRLVVTKTKNCDGQLNLFTGEAFDYSAIVTNDYHSSSQEIVLFYNQRGAAEKEFDILKNDFGWAKMPFSKLEQNTVYLLLCAMCRNLYKYIITLFSQRITNLKANFRIKKFIFRFISIPGKWVKSGGSLKMRLYGAYDFKT